MDAKATSAMHVIKKEDKHGILREFIAQDLEARRKAPASHSAEQRFCVIARSPDSPVARAVAEFADEIAALGMSICAVFAMSPSQLQKSDAKSADQHHPSAAKLLRDFRLLDAHEALLLGDTAAWIGDCMRRDPVMHDAYERFSTDCEFTSASVRSAFDQLWKSAAPLKCNWPKGGRAPDRHEMANSELIAAPALSTSQDPELPAVPSTRH